MAEVSLICKRTSTSSKPVEPGLTYIPLSILDQIMENNHLRLVFYYKFPTGQSRDAGEVTKKLRISISEMLSSFPKVIGRLVRLPEGQWTIKCNDAGLRVVEARVEGTLEEWLQDVDGEKELKLVHWEDMFHKPYYWSTFYVQITEFKDGGLAIGLSCTHLLCDPISATMVIKAWADVTLNGGVSSPPLHQPLPSRTINENTRNQSSSVHMIEHYRSAIQEQPDANSVSNMTTITLHFNQETVRSCIAMAEADDDHETDSLTPFEALTAVFWTRVSRVKGAKTGLIDLSVCLDAREVLSLDKSFFGNCMVYKTVPTGASHVSRAAALIKETVSRIDGDDVVDLIEWLERENIGNFPPIMNGGRLVGVNLENLDSYSAVFEEGGSLIRASCYVETAGVGSGQIVVLPSPETHGRVVAVTIAEDEAEKLLEDAVIKRLGPTIFMGLKKN